MIYRYFKFQVQIFLPVFTGTLERNFEDYR